MEWDWKEISENGACAASERERESAMRAGRGSSPLCESRYPA